MNIVNETEISTGIRIRRIQNNTNIEYPDGHVLKVYNFYQMPLRNQYYLFDLLSEIYSYNENFCREEYIYVSWLAHAIRESEPKVDIQCAEVAGRQKIIDREMKIPMFVKGENGIWCVKFHQSENLN